MILRNMHILSSPRMGSVFFSFSCLTDKHRPDAPIALAMRRISRDLTLGDGSEREIPCDNNTSVTREAEKVALLTECAQYDCGRRLLSGILLWKLLKSRCGCRRFLSLPDCADLFSFKFAANES
jgi:hypothetical protein